MTAAPGIYIPPIRPLWTPGRSLHRLGRSLRRAMGAAGEVDVFGDDGDVLLDDDGKVKICGDCCECAHAELILTIRDSAPCEGCSNNTGFGAGSAFYTINEDADGDYTVPFVSADDTSCLYSLAVDVDYGHRDNYLQDNCNSFNFTHTWTQLRMGIVLTRSTNTITGVSFTPWDVRHASFENLSGSWAFGDEIENNSSITFCGDGPDPDEDVLFFGSDVVAEVNPVV